MADHMSVKIRVYEVSKVSSSMVPLAVDHDLYTYC